MSERSSGILLHITSLPGEEGIGTLGLEAFRFIDLLAETKQSLWQILPLGPVGYSDSPYQCYSAFAGNIMLIDLDMLAEENLLDTSDLNNKPRFNQKKVEYQKTGDWKIPLLKRAFDKFQDLQSGTLKNEYEHFLKEHNWWLKDFSFFMAAKTHFQNTVWSEWPDDLKFRKAKAVKQYRKDLKEAILYLEFLQFMFFRQWFRLKEYANSKGVKIIGDIPLYVSIDSADVWTNTDIFLLDENLRPTEVGGVPPDYFSETGQLWGNPVFNWNRLEERDFDWWIARLHFNLNMFDIVRIDHFRGLESYWSVPAGEKTAINGRWVHAKGYQLLKKFRDQVGEVPLIAEDLGIITPEVENLRDEFHFPGMKVLQFAFTTDATNDYLPHNYKSNFVVYTGTHDNNTTLGWLEKVRGEEKTAVKRYLQHTNRKGLRNAVEMAWSSCAKMAIAPIQDILELDGKARMNVPGTASKNWEWRFQWKQVKPKYKKRLKELTVKYNR